MIDGLHRPTPSSSTIVLVHPLATSLWERVKRHYYPEWFGWDIFGDPHEGKQRDVYIALAARERERAAAEAAETNFSVIICIATIFLHYLICDLSHLF